ncbi:alpha/beta hydrolase [Kitasatospora misakiensis]|uniref:Alpha/beta hydrolase n=1 Tax=Kitasatospora misakiensis TaxID=67330 RepID=A0ABW0WWF0_9ACTN
MMTRFSRRALPAVAAAVLLAACSGGGGSAGAAPGPGAAPAIGAASSTGSPAGKGQADPALRSFYGQKLSWAACRNAPKSGGADGSAPRCATLKVPLDYADPSGGTLDVGVARIAAAKPGRRAGSLVVNPGGPGNSGVNTVLYDGRNYDGPLRERYDLVGFDPRGTGLSAPINCLDDRTRDGWLTTDNPGPDHGKLLADACRAKYGTLLEHIGTRDTARDMDVLRAALGEQKLTYLGSSYGSYLGSVYTEEFPDRVGRLVLDGAIDPAKPLAETNIEQYAGFDRALRAFAAHCAEQAQCPFGTDPGKAADKVAEFLDGLKRNPLTTTGGRTLTAAAAWAGVMDVLYGGEAGWDNLADSIGWAMTRGNGDYLMAYADSYNRRDGDGRYGVSADAYTAIYCADGATDVPTGDALQAAYARLAARAPLITRHEPAAALFDPDCRSWPFRSPERAHPIASGAATPIVVVGSTGDPATPYANAEQLTAQLGNAVLLTREGEGHTGYGHSACVRTAVAAYLVDGTVPAAGTRCASDPVL